MDPTDLLIEQVHLECRKDKFYHEVRFEKLISTYLGWWFGLRACLLSYDWLNFLSNEICHNFFDFYRSTTVDEIINFFSDVSFKDEKESVHLTLTREGRPSGEAYIELETEEDMNKALEKDKAHMGKRYIEGNFAWVFKGYRKGISVIKNRSQGWF